MNVIEERPLLKRNYPSHNKTHTMRYILLVLLFIVSALCDYNYELFLS